MTPVSVFRTAGTWRAGLQRHVLMLDGSLGLSGARRVTLRAMDATLGLCARTFAGRWESSGRIRASLPAYGRSVHGRECAAGAIGMPVGTWSRTVRRHQLTVREHPLTARWHEVMGERRKVTLEVRRSDGARDVHNGRVVSADGRRESTDDA